MIDSVSWLLGQHEFGGDIYNYCERGISNGHKTRLKKGALKEKEFMFGVEVHAASFFGD